MKHGISDDERALYQHTDITSDGYCTVTTILGQGDFDDSRFKFIDAFDENAHGSFNGISFRERAEFDAHPFVGWVATQGFGRDI